MVAASKNGITEKKGRQLKVCVDNITGQGIKR